VWDGCKPVRPSYHGRYSDGFAHSDVGALSQETCNGITVTYTTYGTTERVLSTVLIASIRMAVVDVESSAQNDASGPGYARVTLTHYLSED
jgi:hypothetical protein